MANITVTPITPGRAAVSTANVTDSDTAATSGNTYLIANNGRVYLLLTCSGGGTATIANHTTVDGAAVPAKTCTMTAGKQKIWGPYAPELYNNADGQLEVTVDANTDLFALQA